MAVQRTDTIWQLGGSYYSSLRRLAAELTRGFDYAADWRSSLLSSPGSIVEYVANGATPTGVDWTREAVVALGALPSRPLNRCDMLPTKPYPVPEAPYAKALIGTPAQVRQALAQEKAEEAKWRKAARKIVSAHLESCLP